MKSDELCDKYAEAFFYGHLKKGDLKNILTEYGELVKAEAVKVILGGRFLHDDAPDAKWAKSCAAAIEKMPLP